MRFRSMCAVSAIGALAAIGWAAPASGDGLPIPGVTVKAGGVAAPGSPVHYTTTAGRGQTIVQRTRGDAVTASIKVPGSYTVPAVALDGSPGGLSADGSTLALIKPRATFPQTHTKLALLSTQPSLRLQRRLTLSGDFSFDAISPDGSRLYLIQYLSKRDPTRYAVRALDTASRRLIPGAIVDPREENPDEMRGLPITRVESPNGRWAYTLYSGSPKPFVHALDTAAGKAHCIDLPKLGGGNVYRDHLEVAPGGGSFRVLDHAGAAQAVIDTSTLKASAPAPNPAPTPPDAPQSVDDGSTSAWWLIAAGVALLSAAAALALARRHRAAPSG